MTHEKDEKEKTGKKNPAKNLKEKRAAKAAKRNEKGAESKPVITNPFSKTGKG
jgi:hypothetical protein